jgi:hypothetical protein
VSSKASIRLGYHEERKNLKSRKKKSRSKKNRKSKSCHEKGKCRFRVASMMRENKF